MSRNWPRAPVSQLDRASVCSRPCAAPFAPISIRLFFVADATPCLLSRVFMPARIRRSGKGEPEANSQWFVENAPAVPAWHRKFPGRQTRGFECLV
jgi:hypothetical protein